MTWTKADYTYMARALQLARRGYYTTDPNPRVGCVMVNGDKIVAEGWHTQAGQPHAEIEALRRLAGAAMDSCYITLEPCNYHGRTPPCIDALIQAGIRRLVVAMLDPNPMVAGRGLERARQAAIVTEQGLMEQQANLLNLGFISRMKTGLPYVRCKLAMSLDGRTALKNGASRWITSRAARRDVHRLRASSSAIITGVGTVRADDPLMNVRDLKQAYQPPLKVIIDRKLTTPTTAKMLKLADRVLIITQIDDAKKQQALLQVGAEVVRLACTDQDVWLSSALRYLAQKEQINEVLIEAGSSLSGAFLRAGLIDELLLYIAPKLMGQYARPLLELDHFTVMSDCPRLRISDIRNLGSDIRIRAYPKDNK